jgi:hypothetical protein
MKTALVFALVAVALTGCGTYARFVPSLDACESVTYVRNGDYADIYFRACRVR